LFDLASQAKVNILGIRVDHDILICILQVPLDLLLGLLEKLKCVCSLLRLPPVCVDLQKFSQIICLYPPSDALKLANGLRAS
jgi:hypothetical protein